MNTIIDKTSIINGKYKLISSKDSKIIMGKYCAVADGLKIITLNHDYNFPVIQGTFYKKFFNNSHPGEIIPPNKERTHGDVVIGNDVWIGEDVFILSGVKIGDGCCIGARSVVTKNLEPYSICVGQPCREIKKRYNQEIISLLLELKWWNWSEEKIKKNKNFFYTNLNTISDINEIKKIIN
jgi:acetyltransferase-like isoleucine patch superfamily enzyme